MEGSTNVTVELRGKEYESISEIRGQLLVVEGVSDAGYGELVDIELPSGEKRRGIVLETGRGLAVVQVFEGTTGITPAGSKVRFTGRILEIGLSEDMLGRIMNALGEPIDGGPQ